MAMSSMIEDIRQRHAEAAYWLEKTPESEEEIPNPEHLHQTLLTLNVTVRACANLEWDRLKMSVKCG